MRIAIVTTPSTERNLTLAAQIGVTDHVLRYPGRGLDVLLKARDHVESFGLKASIVEGYLPQQEIILGTAKRDGQIEEMIELVRNMGRAGIDVCCCNWMPCNDWTRTSVATVERGGALVTAYNLADDQYPPPTWAITAEELWSNLEYFLSRVLPVAEDSGVCLAMHPDDPPLGKFRGHDQIMSYPEDFERLLNLSSSKANGICLCQGTFAEMGVCIPETIRKFAPHIRYVHFRDVSGTAENFRETFHDNGKTNMAEAMRTYYECGVDVAARPDHVPTLCGENNEYPGYEMLGRLFAVGYMRGLMHSAELGR